MKWFADDYDMDGRPKVKNIIRELLERYELSRIHTEVGWCPSLDLYETEEDLIMLVDMAGMQAEDVEINLGREHVRLWGNRYKPAEREVTRIHHMEINFGPYDQMIALPEPVDPSGVTTTYRDGFLLIRLPKEVQITNSNP